jgi:glycosyltransferase involved in cell wall biosynthesis
MLISLVLATVERTGRLTLFLKALENQTYRDFELIVVNQNSDARLDGILSRYSDRFRIIHLRCERGVSRARNRGFESSRGDVLGFPDDDCWYPPDLLQKVAESLEANLLWHGVTGRCIMENSDRNHAGIARFSHKPGILTPLGIWTRSSAATVFVRRRVIDQTGLFDESLGPGSGTPWGAAEDMDYLLRAIQNGFTIHYDPELVVIHPSPPSLREEMAYQRAFTYGMGTGRVLRIHNQPFWFVSQLWLRAAGRAAISLLRMNPRAAKFYLRSLRGRVLGWLSAEPRAK